MPMVDVEKPFKSGSIPPSCSLSKYGIEFRRFAVFVTRNEEERMGFDTPENHELLNHRLEQRDKEKENWLR